MKAKKLTTITVALLLMIPAIGFGQIAPNLNSAGEFGVLAGTAISFDGTQTVINDMNVGLYPGKLVSITGDFVVNNGEYMAADSPDPAPAILEQAKDDLTKAYLFAEGSTFPAPADVSTDNLAGETLAPGIYKSTSTLSIEGGDLTLEGSANDVWIFQVAAGLTTTTGGNVVLAGGALAKNVFWQVGSSATIGIGTTFNGNILALTSITVNSDATVNGRALAINGAVTFESGGTMNEPPEGEEPTDPEISFTVTKTANPKTFVAAGDIILYDIEVTNTGTEELTDIVVTDPTATITGGNPIASLAPDETAIVTASYEITPANVNDGFAINIATATTENVEESGYEIVTIDDVPPRPIPLATWAIVLGGVLMAGFVYRRSMLKRIQNAGASGE